MEDIVSIKSNFMKSMVGKLISKMVKKSFGLSADIYVSEIAIAHDTEGVTFNLNLGGVMTEDNFKSLLMKLL